MVAVPELPEDPALYAACSPTPAISRRVRLTAEDRERTAQYQANAARESLRGRGDRPGGLPAQPGDGAASGAASTSVGLQRIVQLINKTNQFNLTTRRYTERRSLAHHGRSARLGAAAAPARPLRRQRHHRRSSIGRREATTTCVIDTWLMSCRVLGRGVEQATLNLIGRGRRGLGAGRPRSAAICRPRRTAWCATTTPSSASTSVSEGRTGPSAVARSI